MTVRVYYSTDASAPVLSGSVGALIGVLDACLVNGYGSKSSSGWAKSYSGTDLAVYRAPSGNRHYLRIDDTGTTSARVACYISMTGVSTGTEGFPEAPGYYVIKSNAASSAARYWMVVATDKQFYLFVASDTALVSADTANNQLSYFGDIVSFKAGDQYATLAMFNNTGATSAYYAANVCNVNSYVQGNLLAKSYLATGVAVSAGKHSNGSRSSSDYMGAGGSTYPDPVTGGVLLHPVYVSEYIQSVTRGRIPGMWDVFHARPGAIMQTINGAGELAGKAFVLCPVTVASGPTYGRVAVEISDTW